MKKLFAICLIIVLWFELAPAQEGCGEWRRVEKAYTYIYLIPCYWDERIDSVWVPKPCPKEDVKMSEKRIEFTKVTSFYDEGDKKVKHTVMNQMVSIPLGILKSAVIEQHASYFSITFWRANARDRWNVKEDPRKYLEEEQ